MGEMRKKYKIKHFNSVDLKAYKLRGSRCYLDSLTVDGLIPSHLSCLWPVGKKRRGEKKDLIDPHLPT